MAYSELALMQPMTDQQRLLFQARYQPAKKSATVGVLLALFLGGLGFHHFYLRRVFVGVFYLVFCWTLFPALVSLLEAFFMSGRVDNWNARTARQLANEVLSLAGNGVTGSNSALEPEPQETHVLGAVGFGLVVGFVLLMISVRLFL